MAHKQKIAKGKGRRSSRNKARGKYSRQWDRTWRNKQKRIARNASTKEVASIEISKAQKAQEVRKK